MWKGTRMFLEIIIMLYGPYSHIMLAQSKRATAQRTDEWEAKLVKRFQTNGLCECVCTLLIRHRIYRQFSIYSKKKWKWKRRKSRNGIYFPLNPAHSIWCGVFTIAKEIRRHSPWQATFCGVSFTVKVKSIILFIILLLNFLFFGWCFDMTCLSSFDCTDYFVYWHRKWFNGTEKRFSAGQLIRCDVCHKVTHFVRWKNIGIIMKKAVAASLWLTQFIIY